MHRGYERTLRRDPPSGSRLALHVGDHRRHRVGFIFIRKLSSYGRHRTDFHFNGGALDASFQSMVEHQQAVAKVLLAHPAVETFSSTVGAGNSGASNGAVQCEVETT
jgi:hypothetical protein